MTLAERERPVHKNKTLSDFIPAIAIAMESLNTFLQRKRNKAMASDLMALRQDKSLAWNSLRQLEKDFLLYRKYNVTQLQDIAQTINGLQNRTMQIKEAFDRPRFIHATDCSNGTRYHKLKLHIHSMLECQIRLCDT